MNEEEEIIVTTDGFANKKNRFTDDVFKTGDEETEEGVADDDYIDDEFSGGFQADEDENAEEDAGEIN